MEKLSQIKSTLFKLLSKQPVSSLMTFQNQPLKSPCRSPIHVVSIIPKEARRKHNKSGNFGTKEPTSPKVSCMGQVQCKKKRKSKKHKRVFQQIPTKNSDSVRIPEKKLQLWNISKESDEGRKQALVLEEKESDTLKVPTLDTMKKFVSGRGSLYDFDATLAER